MKTTRQAWLAEPFDVQPDAREAIQLSAALWIGAALFMSVGSIFAGNIRSVGEYLSIVTGLTSALVIAYGVYQVFRLVAGRPRWLAYIAVGLAVPAASVLQLFVEYGLYFALDAVFPDVEVPPHDIASLLVLVAVYFCLFASNVVLLWVTSANRANQVQARRLEQVRADLLQAELDALRLKLNPHFMFNALSAAISLVNANRSAEGVDMLYRLTDLLRTSFDVGAGDISLNEELSILGDYIAIEQVRFATRLIYRVQTDGQVGDVAVPSFLLQPLVENAVKYAVATSQTPVTITVGAVRDTSNLILTVEDRGSDAKKVEASGSGVGHSATRSRLALRHGDRARFEAGPTKDGYRVTIIMPLADEA